MAVLNAGVMATLQRLGVNATGLAYPPEQVTLLDLGTGGQWYTKGHSCNVISLTPAKFIGNETTVKH